VFGVRRAGRVSVLAAIGFLVGLLLPLVATSPASADFFGRVNCEQFPDHPECEVGAGERRGVVEPVVGSGGEVVCRLDGEVVPCVTEDGWLGSDGCRYLGDDEVPPPTGAEKPGAAYRVTCPGDPPGFSRPWVWLPDREAPGPAALARHAVSRLVLPQPAVQLNPPASASQLVGLPTWFWVDADWWTARSASAFVPGVTVTAVATPSEVRWETGDGQVVRCSGAGTPYDDAENPAAGSPDCGYTYRRSSAGQPGNAYTLTATVTWQVSWSGGGMSGVMDPLTSTSQLQVPVAEVQAVIVR
jgi:hypothetical protein